MVEAEILTELWDEYADRLLLIARSIGGPAEDAVQEAFVALAAQTELPRDPLAWLVRVTRNRLLQWHRRSLRRRKRESLAGRQSWFAVDIVHVDQQLDSREVTSALLTLKSPEREVIVMHLWGEMTFDAIAEVIGGSRASAHRAFQRGLRELQGRFNHESNTDSRRLCNEPR